MDARVFRISEGGASTIDQHGPTCTHEHACSRRSARSGRAKPRAGAHGNAAGAISDFKKQFFQFEHLKRTQKHVSDPIKGSSAKRLNMYLRWMVRPADKGVDFGLWKNIPLNKLMIPLDVHTGNIGRRLGLLMRTQNDWRAVEELMTALRKFDSEDPAKYDFALFGLGVSGF